MIRFCTETNDNLASYRLRTKIACDAVGGVIGRDIDFDNDKVVVFSKHFHPEDVELIQKCNERGIKTVFDICDWHKDNDSVWAHYQQMINNSDVIVTSSAALRDKIASVVIPEPFEYTANAPRFTNGKDGLRILWFGHPSNLRKVAKEFRACIDNYLQIISEKMDFEYPITQWSHKYVIRGLKECDMVIIPHDGSEKMLCKSANRAIETLNAGRFVIASPSPAYDDIKDFIFQGDIAEGIAFARANKKRVLQMITKGQKYVQEHYNVKVIEEKWKKLLSCI